jgi:ubiquinone/menaquinone biosynthesis C-methylase UbiE
MASLATRRAMRHQQRVWSQRAHNWDRHGSAGLGTVTAAVIEAAAVREGDQVLDLGCGQGQIGVPLAARHADVLAIDVSTEMISQLKRRALRDGIDNLAAVALPIEELQLPAQSIDLVVSSYALHHLRDMDKARLVADAYGWLRPGGRFVLADMMFGRGAERRDRQILRQKVVVLARLGPGGWWRIAKNAARYLLRLHEMPVPMSAWVAMMERAGFTDIKATPVVAEACLVTGTRPRESGPAPATRGGQSGIRG